MYAFIKYGAAITNIILKPWFWRVQTRDEKRVATHLKYASFIFILLSGVDRELRHYRYPEPLGL